MTYTVKSTFVNGLEIDVGARHHTIRVDQSAERGGTNKGMNPVELLLAGISTCLTMSILISAEAAKIKIDDISVEVEGEREPSVRPGLTRVKMTVDVKTDAAEAVFRQFLDGVVSNAPVVDSVKNEVVFDKPVLHIR